MKSNKVLFRCSFVIVRASNFVNDGPRVLKLLLDARHSHLEITGTSPPSCEHGWEEVSEIEGFVQRKCIKWKLIPRSRLMHICRQRQTHALERWVEDVEKKGTTMKAHVRSLSKPQSHKVMWWNKFRSLNEAAPGKNKKQGQPSTAVDWCGTSSSFRHMKQTCSRLWAECLVILSRCWFI